ncbi:MAG: type III pantothenate kinase [Bacteroidales bacterium]|nr:type III pantothenate kinase [Bacteroidales bacterium]
MDIVIDVGNSCAKIALFEDGQLADKLRVPALSVDVLELLFDKYKIVRGILSSVVNLSDDCLSYLKSSLKYFLVLDDKTKIPVEVGYRTPETLGKDRLAAVVGAVSLRPGENLLIVDAGTAITFDCVTAEGCYKGGNISPGVKMRLRALHTFTDKLPLIDKDGELPFIGYSTETAIRAGVVYGIALEIEGYIKALKEEMGQLSVFLTGGNAFYFEKKLKSSIFAEVNLVLIGLYRILLYNVE